MTRKEIDELSYKIIAILMRLAKFSKRLISKSKVAKTLRQNSKI